MRSFAIVLFCVAYLACAHANPLFETAEYVDDEGEGRIFTNGFSLMNATIDLRALLAALLLSILFALILGSAFLGDNQESSGYGYGYQKQGQQGYYDNSQFYARSDKNAFDADLAAQMAQLAEAFKKYEVEELSCQMYVACEASQEARHEENGQLARDVHNIMKNMKKRGRQAVQEKDEYVAQLLDAFVYGETRQQQLKDACEKLRNKCYDATKKPAY
jgi:hypothetical protein